MYTLIRSSLFDRWLRGIRDIKTYTRILDRLDYARQGNFGDYKSLGGALFELRLHFGSGYRIYFTIVNNTIIFLLAGGDKDSQTRDIAKARALMEEQ